MGFLVFLGSLLASFRIGMCLHELAHALAAVLLRVRFHAVQFGTGRTWARARIAGVEWRLCGTLAGGLVETKPASGRRARMRYGIVVAAGPAVDFVVAAVCTWAALGIFGVDFPGASASGEIQFSAVTGFTVGAWWSFIQSVSLRSSDVAGREQLTDAGLVHRLWTEPPEEYAYVEVMLRALDKLRRLDPMPIRPLIEDWSLLAADPLFAELEAATVALINAYPVHDPKRWQHVDELCTRALFSGDRAAKERCLPWSKALYEHCPPDWTVVGTHGSILLTTGHVAEGTWLLEQLMAEDEEPWDRAIAACCLAWSAHRRGDPEGRERWWRESLRLNGGKPVIPWMARELAT